MEILKIGEKDVCTFVLTHNVIVCLLLGVLEHVCVFTFGKTLATLDGSQYLVVYGWNVEKTLGVRFVRELEAGNMNIPENMCGISRLIVFHMFGGNLSFLI